MRFNRKAIVTVLLSILVISLVRLFSQEINGVVTQEVVRNGQYTFKEKNLKYVVNYKNDTIHGDYWIYEDEKLIEKGRVCMGYKDGSIYTYLPKQTVIKFYEYGVLDKIHIKYSDGNIYFIYMYDKNGRLRKLIEYNFNTNRMDTSITAQRGAVFKKCYLDSYKDLLYCD